MYQFPIVSFRSRIQSKFHLVIVLILAIVLNLESLAMDVIDPKIMEQFKSAGNKPISVIITCQSECKAVVEALENAGIKITNIDSMILGSIAAEINKDQLNILQTISGISAIELEQEERALGK